MDGHGIEVGMAAVQWWFTSPVRLNEGARDGAGEDGARELVIAAAAGATDTLR